MGRNNNGPDEDMEIFGMGGMGSFCKPTSHIHEFYLSGEIGPPERYAAIFAEIRQAPEQDTVYIHLNSGGGNAFTCIQFLRVLFETRANTVASIEGMCSSAATMIFLACRYHEVTDFSIFMVHNFSSMTMGKGHELYANISHMKVWSEDMITKMYQHFLTPEEIKEVLKGEDMYLTAAEVERRIKHRGEVFTKIVKQHKKEQKVKEVVVASGVALTKKPRKNFNAEKKHE